MPKLGIIAGSGFYEIEGVRVKELRKVATPFGEPSDAYRICDISGREIAFLSRHGTSHHIPPHKINYRANIWGFREIGVERIFSVNAVGGMNRVMKPGDIVIPDQIIDMTFGRASTFYEDGEVVHIDFTDPYCSELRNVLLDAGKRIGIALKESGTYICVNGPRLETRAEILFFSKMEGDVIGMTGMPEACLARELEICFGAVAIVTNYAAGISPERLTTKEVIATMKTSMERIRNLLLTAALDIGVGKRSCGCEKALRDARM